MEFAFLNFKLQIKWEINIWDTKSSRKPINNEKAKINSNQVSFLEYIKKFEDQIKTNEKADQNAFFSYDLPHEPGARQKKSLKDFKPLKTKTFIFNRKWGKCQLVAL